MSTLEEDPTFYQDNSNVINLLAQQLILGRLCLLVGAGASMSAGLPNWENLLSSMYRDVGNKNFDSEQDLGLQATVLLNESLNKNRSNYLDLIHKHLYQNFDGSLAKLSENKLLRSIGAMCMASRRGHVSNIINFNFDDILETYLEYHGYMSLSVSNPDFWERAHDVKIIHPHSFLPYVKERERSKDVVFAQGDFFQAICGKDGWRPIIEQVIKTHMLLLVGLSGDDINLQSLIEGNKETHPSFKEKRPYYGFSLGLKESDKGKLLLRKNYAASGILTIEFGSKEEIPDFLFAICQAAAKKLRTFQSGNELA